MAKKKSKESADKYRRNANFPPPVKINRFKKTKKIREIEEFDKSMEESLNNESEQETENRSVKKPTKSKSSSKKFSTIHGKRGAKQVKYKQNQNEDIDSQELKKRNKIIILTVISIGVVIATIVFVVLLFDLLADDEHTDATIATTFPIMTSAKTTTASISTSFLVTTSTKILTTTTIRPTTMTTTRKTTAIPTTATKIHTTTKPPKIVDKNLTGLCQKIGRCLYCHLKFVQAFECGRFVRCKRLDLEPVIPLDQHNKKQLQFIHVPFFNSHKPPQIQIPDGTLCRNDNNDYGFCSQDECIVDKNITEADVNATQSVNGGWSEFSSEYNGSCISMPNKNYIEIWENITSRTKCGNCNFTWRTFEFRSCNNPPPASGGNLCWNSTHDNLQFYEWPLRWSEPCPGCVDPNGNKVCNRESKEINCLGNASSNSVLALDNEYCCIPGNQSPIGPTSWPGRGQCIAKHCLPVNYKI